LNNLPEFRAAFLGFDAEAVGYCQGHFRNRPFSEWFYALLDSRTRLETREGQRIWHCSKPGRNCRTGV
jgi:hypothetical protein